MSNAFRSLRNKFPVKTPDRELLRQIKAAPSKEIADRLGWLNGTNFSR
ncbi:MAG: hypothetical protein LH614_15105 [Pyrinomonadaceae bacterium]|nr:hypothetical protein [Pyrinomonadaceae bacterium]